MKNVLGVLLVIAVLAVPAHAEDGEAVRIPVPAWTRAATSPPVFGQPPVVQRCDEYFVALLQRCCVGARRPTFVGCGDEGWGRRQEDNAKKEP